VRRLTADHLAGGRRHETAFRDESGRSVLGLAGTWAVTDDQGRWTLYLAPDYGSIIKGAITTGIMDSIIGGPDGPPVYQRNSGPGVQTIHRAKVPLRGASMRSTMVVSVSRELANTGQWPPYSVQSHEAGWPDARFEQTVESATLAAYANGYGDPRRGVYDLVHLDGRPIARHWATVDKKGDLERSVLDVVDEEVPLDEVAILCLARHLASRT
jgi:hypothetical protein